MGINPHVLSKVLPGATLNFPARDQNTPRSSCTPTEPVTGCLEFSSVLVIQARILAVIHDFDMIYTDKPFVHVALIDSGPLFGELPSIRLLPTCATDKHNQNDKDLPPNTLNCYIGVRFVEQKPFRPTSVAPLNVTRFLDSFNFLPNAVFKPVTAQSVWSEI